MKRLTACRDRCLAWMDARPWAWGIALFAGLIFCGYAAWWMPVQEAMK